MMLFADGGEDGGEGPALDAMFTSGSTLYLGGLDAVYGDQRLLLSRSGGTQDGFPEEWWTPALRAQLVLGEFGATDWRSKDPGPPPSGEEALREEVTELLNLRSRRAALLPEIIAQDASFVHCWMGLLGGSRRPYTATLVSVGVAVGTVVAMHWKARYARARPAQVFPLLLPPIPTPPHPSYPSGHALQSHLVSLLIQQALPGGTLKSALKESLDAMARRIAKNREIAGLHFRTDTEAGRKLAEQVLDDLLRLPALESILAKASREWEGIRPGPKPAALEEWPALADSVAAKVVAALREKEGTP